jgi:DNA-binding NarL/FixJ family response regulator
MNEDSRADRRSPVGEPVVRSDPEVTGERAAEAVGFDPDDPESVAEAAETVARFAAGDVGDEDNVLMLRGAAACAALVRGVGSYKEAAERAGDDVSVAFIRKWARVHDLPQAIRRQVAGGRIAPSAAKHIARLGGTDRYLLAWTVIDGDLTVREVRSIASAVNDGADIETAVREAGVDLGHIDLRLPLGTYVELRRRASNRNTDPGTIVAEALDDYFAAADSE